MLARLGLRARLTGIVLVSILCLWLVLVAAAYRMRDLDSDFGLPPPDRVAALVALAELTPTADRPRLFLVAEAGGLRVRTEPRPPIAGSAEAADHRVVQPYLRALEGRVVTIRPVLDGWQSRRVLWVFAAGAPLFVLEVALAAGDTLVVSVGSPLPVTAIGLPVGVFAGIVGTLAALAALIVLHREIRPLMRLAAAVDRVDPVGEPVPLPVIRARAPEIRALVTAFERLQGRLAAMLRARMALIGGIQHDLRTMATRLRLRVERIPDPAERDRAVGDIADMIALLDDAMLASRAGARELDEELVPFAPLVAAEVEDRRRAGAPVDLRLGPGDAEAAVIGDRVGLRRIVGNLVANAVTYGRVAHVQVEAAAEGRSDLPGGCAVLTVDDEGPGIPADKRTFLLEPFVRLEESRARRTGGAGLGLAIVRSLVEAHGGTVDIGDAPGGGARVVVRLPLFRA
ncbi:histidine kinase [Azospirillum sp. RWY-5-1]|uniref:histidine kinase n=1 Tax=Azospirillum oleiclasticum TaxID=2735135 RepID=A0ABX2TG48_9PROT|nr:histidine kinase [Azospirillum oleiclasticum]NYZ23310.1 histidine kinase [Azospirillum oleiclasticum]